MVLCGIRDQAQLELYKPDLIVKDLSEAVDLVMRPSLPHRLGNTASPQKLLISQSRTKVNTVENCWTVKWMLVFVPQQAAKQSSRD